MTTLRRFFFVLLAVTTAAMPLAAEAGPRNGGKEGKVPLYALARQAGLTTLADAIEIAGLQKTVNVDGPWTVFAPTNEAFAALPEGVLESLVADPEALAGILLYHVAAGEYFAADVVGLRSLAMADGNPVDISVGSTVMINDATILRTDVQGRNGVVHVIDAVLIPPMDGAAAVAPGLEKFSDFSTAPSRSMGSLKAGYQD